MKATLACLLALTVLSAAVSGKYNFPKPQMGWNSWNKFGCDVNEEVIRQTADDLVSTGLAALGYNYVNIDDCWSTVDRSPTGSLQNDPDSFPSGIKPLADYVHAKGLKLGIYSDAGTLTCAGRAGSMGSETLDAQTWAAWGVDYLKYDNCNNNDLPTIPRYTAMANALASVDREIFFSLCEWGRDEVWGWGNELGNSWRTTGDIRDHWDSMRDNFFTNAKHAEAAGPTLGWNDPDMLEVGNGGMSTTEYRTHFTLWAIMKAPLLIGCDISNMSDDTKSILMNPNVIAINQDSLGIQAKCILNCWWHSNGVQIWGGPLSDGYVIAIINWSDSSIKDYPVTVNELPMNSPQYVFHDLWAENTNTVNDSHTYDLDKHETKLIKITPFQAEEDVVVDVAPVADVVEELVETLEEKVQKFLEFIENM